MKDVSINSQKEEDGNSSKKKIPGRCHRVLNSGKKKHGYCNKDIHKNGMCKYHFYKKRKAEPFHPMFK
jgi:hypothetical protein